MGIAAVFSGLAALAMLALGVHGFTAESNCNLLRARGAIARELSPRARHIFPRAIAAIFVAGAIAIAIDTAMRAAEKRPGEASVVEASLIP